MSAARDYVGEASAFAESLGLAIDWEYVGHERPPFETNADRPPVAHFRLTMKREGRPSYSGDFYDSVADSYEACPNDGGTFWRRGQWKPVPQRYYGKLEAGSRRTLDSALTEAAKGGTVGWAGIVIRRRVPAPTAYDLLACVQKSDPGPFEEWCAEMGASPDSKRDTETYLAVVREYHGVRRLFDDEELQRLAEIS